MERGIPAFFYKELNISDMTVAQVIRIMYSGLAINDHLVRWRRVAVSATIRRRARNFGLRWTSVWIHFQTTQEFLITTL